MLDHLSPFLVFLVQAVVISLSGVLAPGPMTAAAVAAGSRIRHAVVEMPLMVLIILGLGPHLEKPGVRLGIGLAGGAFLLLMGGQMLRTAARAAPSGGQYGR